MGPSFLTVNGPDAGVPHLVRVRIRVGARVSDRSGTVVRVRAQAGSGLLALLGSAFGLAFGLGSYPDAGWAHLHCGAGAAFSTPKASTLGLGGPG